MFTSNSRYANQLTTEVKTKNGGKVQAVKLRQLPDTPGNLTEVRGADRLDIMAHRNHEDGTRFWHIADANTELQANDLIEQEPPENPLAKQEMLEVFVPEDK